MSDEYREKYEKLVSFLWNEVDYLGQGYCGNPGDPEYWRGANDERKKIHSTVKPLLPPRPPRYEEVAWWQAIEGLKTGKYRQAFVSGVCLVWHDGELSWEDDKKGYVLDDGDLGTWRAELNKEQEK